MPVKIARKVTFDVDVKCPTLGIDKQVTVDEDGLRKVYNEVDQLCEALAGALGDVRLPAYKSPPHREHTTQPQGDNAAKLLNYAKTVADFTIKGACEALAIGYQVVYENAVKLERDGWLTKSTVAGGIAHLYKYNPPKETLPAIDAGTLPDGKVPFPDKRMLSPEAEKIKARTDRY